MLVSRGRGWLWTIDSLLYGVMSTTDDECVARAAGQGGGPGTENFCRRESCASQAGSCSFSESLSSTCGGEVNTVCGCDGVTYVNSCWAAVARTNVASAGPCP